MTPPSLIQLVTTEGLGKAVSWRTTGFINSGRYISLNAAKVWMNLVCMISSSGFGAVQSGGIALASTSACFFLSASTRPLTEFRVANRVHWFVECRWITCQALNLTNCIQKEEIFLCRKTRPDQLGLYHNGICLYVALSN